MWMTEPVNMAPPRALFSAGSAADVAAWRAENTWADATRLVLFQGDAEGDVREIGIPFADNLAAHDVPWRVLGAPTSFPTRKDLEARYRAHGEVGDTFVDAVRRYRRAIRAASDAVGRGVIPTWTILAGADDGILAVELAAHRGRHVALADGQPSQVAISLAVELGVSILVTTRSDQHRRNVTADLERLKWH